MTEPEYFTKEHASVIATVRTAAVAVAEMWDEIGAIEGETGKQFDGTMAMLEELAAACNAPASPSDLDDEDILLALNAMEVEE